MSLILSDRLSLNGSAINLATEIHNNSRLHEDLELEYYPNSEVSSGPVDTSKGKWVDSIAHSYITNSKYGSVRYFGPQFPNSRPSYIFLLRLSRDHTTTTALPHSIYVSLLKERMEILNSLVKNIEATDTIKRIVHPLSEGNTPGVWLRLDSQFIQLGDAVMVEVN